MDEKTKSFKIKFYLTLLVQSVRDLEEVWPELDHDCNTDGFYGECTVCQVKTDLVQYANRASDILKQGR